MALFGLFKKKSGDESPLAKLAERTANKRGQAVDRWEAIQQLASMHTEESVAALLPRFTFYVDPSITDQEEKDLAFRGIVDSGEVALEPVLAFLRRAESISWPVKMLYRIVPTDTVVEKLAEILDGMDVEYERDPQRKIQILVTLAEHKDDRILPAVSRFLEDANETVRFNAVGALLAQEDMEPARDAMVQCVSNEESLRIRNRILDGFVARSWQVQEPSDEFRAKLPEGFRLDRKGALLKA